MKKIPLSGGKYWTVVDDSDFEYLSRFNWSAQSSSKAFYATRKIHIKGKKSQKAIYMHVEIFGGPCDHKSRNSLDNRRKNLRKATRSQQSYNPGLHCNNQARYKGVFQGGGRLLRWKARCWIKGKVKYLGTYRDILKAARAYDLAVLRVAGEYACLNFPPVKGKDGQIRCPRYNRWKEEVAA